MQIQVIYDDEPVLYTTGGRPKKHTTEFIEKLAVDLEQWTAKSDDNIFLEGFCYEHKIDEDLMSQFSKINENFSGAVKQLKAKQKLALYKKGLDKTFSHPMCQLILGHNHGVYAKTEQKLIGDSSNPLNFVLGVATSQKSQELIDGESIHTTAIEYSQREVGEPLVANDQPIPYSEQERPEDTV